MTTEQELKPLLYDREQVQRLLNVSKWTIAKLEREGRLTRIKLTQGPNAKAYFEAAEVRALVRSLARKNAKPKRVNLEDARNGAEQSAGG